MVNFTKHSLFDKVNPQEPRRKEIKQAFKEFLRPPTLSEVKHFYQNKIDFHQKELEEAEECLMSVKQEQTLKLKGKLGVSHRARPRKKISPGNRPL